MRELQYRSTTRNAMLTSLANVESGGATACAEAEAEAEEAVEPE
ncbi:hypothetical protein GCM10027610_139890 [Dactylosporangium cerinum]